MKNQRCVQSGLAASSLDKVEWNSMFSAFWLFIEGAAEKVQQFIMQLKSIYNKKHGFVTQTNAILNTTERFKQELTLFL